MGDAVQTPSQETSTQNIVILKNIKLTSLTKVPISQLPNDKQLQGAVKILPNSAVRSTLASKRLGQQVKIVPIRKETNSSNTGIRQPLEDDSEVKRPLKIKKHKKVPIFTEHTGPVWHKVRSNFVTKPIISANLPKAFKHFPIFGKPRNYSEMPQFQKKALREFVGLTDNDNRDFCSPKLLLTGRELKMDTLRPVQGLLSASMALRKKEQGSIDIPEQPKLLTLRRLQSRLTRDPKEQSKGDRKLKYRGVRILPLKKVNVAPETEQLPPDLEPGHDVLFRVRVYRPFTSAVGPRYGHNLRGRNSVFNCDVVVLGRQLLSELRDRIVCRNDMDLRMDISGNPKEPPTHSSRDTFPSNFMFINNVFYVDTRGHCRDHSARVRQFAAEKGLGTFPVRDMCRVTIADIQPRIAYPEVYYHQGNCEHIFQFSEVRLLGISDPLHLAFYPTSTAVSQHQTLYCNTCAEFAAKWIVTHSHRIPFDPAFFCETCFYSYMYVGGRKVEDFRAYLYKGNELNLMRPALSERRAADGEEGVASSGNNSSS